MLKKTLHMLLMIMLITGCNETNLAKYEETDFGISFKYPEDWIVTEVHGAPLWLGVSTGKYRPAFNPVEPVVILMGFKPKNMEILNSMLETVRIEENHGVKLRESKVSIGGMDAKKYETEGIEDRSYKGNDIFYVIEAAEMSFLVEFPYMTDEDQQENMKKIKDIIKSIKFTKD